nr:hypothetical protein [Tanacetum cinerariifolium]
MAEDLIQKIYKIANSPRQQVQTSRSGNTFPLAVAFFFTQWEVPFDSGNFLTSSGNALLKRKGFNLEQEKAKKQKTLEEVLDKEKSPEEKVKEMMQLVPIEEVYVQALQVKHPIIDWKIHIEGQMSY